MTLCALEPGRIAPGIPSVSLSVAIHEGGTDHSSLASSVLVSRTFCPHGWEAGMYNLYVPVCGCVD